MDPKSQTKALIFFPPSPKHCRGCLYADDTGSEERVVWVVWVWWVGGWGDAGGGSVGGAMQVVGLELLR